MARKKGKQIDYARPDLRAGALAFWRSNGGVLLIGVVVWLVIVLAYAGPMAAVAASGLVFDGGVLLLWLAAAAGIGSFLLPLFRTSEADRLLRAVTTTTLGLGALSLLVLALGLLGMMSRPVAIGLVAAGDLMLVARLTAAREALDAARHWAGRPAGWGWLVLLAVPVAAMMTVGAMLPPYALWWGGEPHWYDVLEYHLQIPREWYEAGRIVPLRHNAFSFFPFNVEMHYLLAMHLRGGPWAGMYLAQFMHAAFVALSVLAGAALAKRLTGDVRAAVVAALAIAGAPMLAQVGAIAYDEGGFVLFGTLSIGWALLALRESDHRLSRFSLAGVMAGLACGSKLTAVPEVLTAIAGVAAVLLLAWPDERKRPLGKQVAAVAVFGALGMACFAPWLVRTAAWSGGNPVFPELPQLGHGHFSDVQIERWRHAHAPRADQRSIPARAKAGWHEVIANWQYGFVLLPAAVVAAAMRRRSREAQFLAAMLAVLCAFWLGFTHLQGRFFILGVPICAMLMALAPRAMWPVAAAEVVAGAVMLHLTLTATPNRPWGEAVYLIGTEQFIPEAQWLTPKAVAEIPKGEPIVLVGDARAFLYQVSMSRLSYRTIFDADTSNGRGVIDAWTGGDAKGKWLVVDPNELKRFEKTYQPFPTLPPEIAARDETFVIRR